jgi:hypothetical protein
MQAAERQKKGGIKMTGWTTSFPAQELAEDPPQLAEDPRAESISFTNNL